MKIRFLSLLIIAALTLTLFTGCRVAANTAQSAANAVENKIDRPSQTSPGAAITAQQAQKIALDHAGFTADQVTRLHAEYDTGPGAAYYDVEFDAGQWEYDYKINAQTGEILSYEKDD